MKQCRLTGLELVIIKEALFRPNDGATVDTFISIQRLVGPLRLKETLKEKESYEVELEDSDFQFLLKEWTAANDHNKPMWTRTSVNGVRFDLMEAVISVNTTLKALNSST